MNFLRLIPLIVLVLQIGTNPPTSRAQTTPPNTEESRERLTRVLQSNASLKEKADACRQLALIGDRESVKTLATLLGDELLSHRARYAMEPIPDPAVDEAFRQALSKLNGRPLIGVIGSLGVRRDVKAVEPIARLMQNTDPLVAAAAARALGSIGTTSAAEHLQTALTNASAILLPDLCEGLFRCAERLFEAGWNEKAVQVYTRLSQLPEAPHAIRAGALQGLIHTQPEKRLSLLQQALRNKDYLIFSAAVQVAQHLPGAEITRTLIDALPLLSADSQILVIQALAERGDSRAVSPLLSLAKSGPVEVRLAALRALPAIPDPSAIPPLTQWLEDPEAEIRSTARESLAALPGHDVDKAVLSLLNNDNPGNRLAGIELMERRRMTESSPTLIQIANHETNPQVRNAALNATGELGSPAMAKDILAILLNLNSPQALDAARQALNKLCFKAEKPESFVPLLGNAMPQSTPEQQTMLLRTLASIGGPDALNLVRSAVGSPSDAVRTVAIRALGSWKSAASAPDLLTLARQAPDPNDRMLGLRGFLSLAARPDLPTEKRLEMCRQAAELVQREDEVRLLLAALGNLPSLDALPLILPHLDNPATQQEAATAVLSVAEQLLGNKEFHAGPQLLPALDQVSQDIPNNSDLTSRVRELKQKASP